MPPKSACRSATRCLSTRTDASTTSAGCRPGSCRSKAKKSLPSMDSLTDMKLQHLEEPRLVFAYGEHVCPRHGIAAYRVFDAKDSVRRDKVLVGAVGDSVSLEAFNQWI